MPPSKSGSNNKTQAELPEAMGSEKPADKSVSAEDAKDAASLEQRFADLQTKFDELSRGFMTLMALGGRGNESLDETIRAKQQRDKARLERKLRAEEDRQAEEQMALEDGPLKFLCWLGDGERGKRTAKVVGAIDDTHAKAKYRKAMGIVTTAQRENAVPVDDETVAA